MKEIKNDLNSILAVISIFRMEKQKWPLHAAELQFFALEMNYSLNFSHFHRFRFVALSGEKLKLELLYALTPTGWAQKAQVLVQLGSPLTDQEANLPLEIQWKSLSPEKTEIIHHCSVGAPANEPEKISA